MRSIPSRSRALPYWGNVHGGTVEKDEVYVTCADMVDDYISDLGLKIDEQSRINLIKAAASALNRASIDLEQEAERLAAFVTPASPLPQTVADRSVPIKNSGESLRDLLEAWAQEAKPKARTRYSWSRVIGDFCDFLGHEDASAITVEDVIRWKDRLVEQGRRAKTIREGKLAALHAVFAWSVRNRKLSQNPAESVRIDVRVRPAERRRGFHDEEAAALLRAACSESGLLRWGPWLCAFSGARISEVSQLRAEDIQERDDIWCMALTPEAGSLKNLHSERRVPLHSAVLSSGFLEFVKQIGDGPLFAEVPPDHFQSRGGNATKRIGKWVRKLGFRDPRISPSHSWRHRFKTLARRYQLAPDISDAICGHQPRTIGDSYGTFEMATLKREIEKIPGCSVQASS
jgi:integrase